MITKVEYQNKISISASLMCANQLELLNEIRSLELAGINAFHIDIMDNHFVPNLGLSIDTLKKIKSITKLPLEVHLMIEYPESILFELVNNEVDIIILHIESKFSLPDVLSLFDKSSSKLGIAISPATPFHILTEDILKKIDYLLFLTVNPGFAGQPMIENIYDKIKNFLNKQSQHDMKYIIDGHVNKELINKYYLLGITHYVGGTSGLFKNTDVDRIDYKENLKLLRNGR